MKNFKTYRQQLSILRSRGLVVPKTGLPMRILENENYYKLINGYKDLFLDTSSHDEIYRQGTQFSEVKSLYDFDRKLRLLFLEPILMIEAKLKSSIAYEFSSENGHDNYLKNSSFNDLKQTGAKHTTLLRRTQDISELIAHVQSDISSACLRKDYVKHYLQEYGYVPLWVLINSLSLGTVSKFYHLMKDKERIEVAKRFFIHNNELDQAIKILGAIRNITAHDERLYNVRLKNGYEIMDTPIHHQLSILKLNGKYIYGKNDLFSVVIILKRLLSKSDFIKFYKQLKTEINAVLCQLPTISRTAFLHKLGFPQNWDIIVITNGFVEL